MLVGVAFLPPSFPPSRTQAFYIIKRQNCVYFCNRVYVCRERVNALADVSNFSVPHFGRTLRKVIIKVHTTPPGGQSPKLIYNKWDQGAPLVSSLVQIVIWHSSEFRLPVVRCKRRKVDSSNIIESVIEIKLFVSLFNILFYLLTIKKQIKEVILQIEPLKNIVLPENSSQPVRCFWNRGPLTNLHSFIHKILKYGNLTLTPHNLGLSRNFNPDIFLEIPGKSSRSLNRYQ